MKIRISFRECEHDGDLNNYAEGVIAAGGSVVEQDYDGDGEVGWIVAEVTDLTAFKARFQATDAAGFSYGLREVK
jgi:hypothetical protein